MRDSDSTLAKNSSKETDDSDLNYFGTRGTRDRAL